VEDFTGLIAMVANVSPEGHESPDKRGEAQNKNQKKYAHEIQAQG
jgi:hypothetical protein